MDYSEPCVITKPPKNSLLKHLRIVFDKGSMIDQAEFQLITSAFGNRELMTDENIFNALKELKDNLHKVYQTNIYILIHLVLQLRKSKDSYKLKSSKPIDYIYTEISNYMWKLSSQDISDCTIKFQKRGNFIVGKFDNVCSPNVYHNLHKGIISIIQFNESNPIPKCFDNISIIFKWSKLIVFET
jgi:hypothetical protein